MLGRPFLMVSGDNDVFLDDDMSVLGWINVKAFGAVGNGSTDDTGAIQAAINAAGAAGGGVVFFPDGEYIIAGPLQDTSGYNAQLTIPHFAIPTSYDPAGVTTREVKIELRGNGGVMDYWFNNASPHRSGAILRSTLPLGTITGSPAILAGSNVDATFSSGGSWITVVIRGLTVRSPDDPWLTAIQMRGIETLVVEHCSIDTNVAVIHASQPTHANAIGLDCTDINMDRSTISDVQVTGYYTGMRANECLHVSEQVWFLNCYRAVELTGMFHAVWISRLGIVHCAYGIVFSGAGHSGSPTTGYVTINQLDFEHAAAADGFSTWQLPVADIYDPNNYAHGSINYLVILWNVGVSSLIVNGGSHLVLTNIAA